MKLKDKIILKLFTAQLNKISEGLPPPKLNEGLTQDYDVIMRDGVSLKTHVCFPDKAGDYPVILVRSPYISTPNIQMIIFKQLIKHGFILCFQECRGRGMSGGVFEPFINERSDGIDTFNWLKSQRFLTKGAVLLGGSYLSYTQMCTADVWPEFVKGAFLPVFPFSVYELFYQNSMFREQFLTTWALQNNSVSNMPPVESVEAFKNANTILPRSRVIKNILGQDLPFFDKVYASSDKNSEFWHTFDVANPQDFKAPVYLLGGWYDFSASSQYNSFNSLPKRLRDDSRFFMGPFSHALMNNGDFKTPDADICGMAGTRLALEWFLKLFYNYEMQINNSVKLYVTGEGYLDFKDIPTTNAIRYYFNNDTLTESAPANQTLSFNYDPLNPSPTCGGGDISPMLFGGKDLPKQCSSIIKKKREDTLYFYSQPFSEDKTILGVSNVSLRVCSSANATAFSVKLIKQVKNKDYYIAAGITEVKLNNLDSLVVNLALSPNGYKIKKGERLGVYISSADSPAFHTHINSDKDFSVASEVKTAKQSVYLGAETFIDIPFLN